MKKLVVAASLLALVAPGCIVVDDEAAPPCETGDCPDIGAEDSGQHDSSQPSDTGVDSTIVDSTILDSTPEDTDTAKVDSANDVVSDSAIDTAVDVSVDTSTVDSADAAASDADAPVDTSSADTAEPDTHVADTAIEDTFVADTHVPDAVDDASVDAADAADAAPTCPTGKGSAMVRVTGSGDGGAYTFCVDKYEATNADYAAFLASSPATTGQPADCTGNSTYTPSSAWPAASTDANKPVVYVDWCDAAAYCKWAGKRLCGKIGGGAFGAGTTENQDVNVSEWVNVCRAANTANTYPYGGTTYNATACRGNGHTTPAPTSPLDVGSLATCEGGYSGIFDMSGNVYEWLNACLPGATSNCIIAGGSFKSGSASLSCPQKNVKAKNVGADDTGIRCCAD